MEFKYRVEAFPFEEASTPGGEPAPGVVYACDVNGECSVRDLHSEHRKELQEFLNDMGREGWELIQIFPQRAGVVTFWKRVVDRG
jgi:hypothetical protein